MTAEADAGLLANLLRILNENPSQPIAVAVSGGGDSMALLDLAQQAHPGRIHAVTVDHGLRPESAIEAAGVATFCARQGMAHQILRWHGPEPTGNLMAQAGAARLSLMASWAQGQGIADVLLGHTADDQAETFLMALARASGVDGLAGLRPRFVAHGVTFHRPLLEVTRADLRRYLTGRGIAWVDDPSNENDRFTRAKARKALAALGPLGIKAETLACTVRNIAAARAGLQAALADFVSANLREVAGALQMEGQAFDRLPDELSRRLLIAALRWIAGASHPPRETQLDQLRVRLAARQEATLGGVRFLWRADMLTIARELRAAQGAVDPALLWDGRWRLEGPAKKGTLRALGLDGLALCPDRPRDIPRAALVVSPSLWADGTLIAAPLAGFGPDFTAKLSQGFTEFILSH